MQVTQEMLEAAMNAAVQTGLIPKHSDGETYLKLWGAMKQCIQAATDVGQHGDHSCIQRLREELDVTDNLLAERTRLLQIIPACDAHGDQCVPHAMEWVRDSILLRLEAQIEEPPNDGLQPTERSAAK